MTFQEYQQQAKRTMREFGDDRDYLHMHMGMQTESGEFIDQLKKHLVYGKELDVVNLKEEFGDYMWYLANFQSLVGEFDWADYEKFADKSLQTPLEKINWWKMLEDLYNEEIDVLGFMFLAAAHLGDLHEMLDTNIQKLKARFPDKFTEENAIVRDLEKERKILERVPVADGEE